jgi:hypothetical protein
MSALLSALVSSALSLATVSRGMPVGPTTPWNEPVSKPGRPFSATVGVLCAEGTRCALEMASGLSLPPVTEGQVASMPLNSTSAWPATTAVTASAPPL